MRTAKPAGETHRGPRADSRTRADARRGPLLVVAGVREREPSHHMWQGRRSLGIGPLNELYTGTYPRLATEIIERGAALGP